MTINFIEGCDAEKYADHASNAKQNFMVHQNEDGSLTCDINGTIVNCETPWQLSSRANAMGIYGASFWLDTMFSAPGVLMEGE